jgi:amino acid transporter
MDGDGGSDLEEMSADASAELVAHTVRLPEVIAQSVGAMGITGVVALIVPIVAVTARSGGWLTWVTASVVLLLVAWCISRLASQFATTGGPYGLVSKALGRFGGVFIGWTTLVFVGLFSAGTLMGFGVYATQFTQAIGIGSGSAALAAFYAVGLLAALLAALSGMNKSAMIMLALEILTAIVIVVLLVAVLANHHGSVVDHSQLTLRHSSLNLVLDGFVLAVLSFGGFESATVLGREARNPLRAIPVAMISTVIIAGVFWTICAYVFYLGFEGSHVDLARSVANGAPLQDLASIAQVGWLRDVIDLTVSLTLLGSIIAIFNGVTRLMFTMAREGLAPASLLKIHRRYDTPWVACVALAAIWLATAIVVVATNVAPFTVVGDFGDVSGYGFMVIYAVTSLGALVYLGRTKQLRALDAVAAATSIVVMGYVFYENAFLPSPDGWIFYAVLGSFAFFALAYAIIRWLRPSYFAGVGSSVDADTEL